ncbi:hypothetical protein GG851_02780 [Bordetella petrii]|nr:hypothetical protein [Bordetella petrii]
MVSRRAILKTSALAGLGGLLPMWKAAAMSVSTPLVITTTGILTTQAPYAHTSIHLYYIWSLVYGSLMRYNYQTKQYEGVLAKKWEIINPTTWRFYLRDDLKRHDGGPGPTAGDVVHSWKRIMSDTDSQQRFYMSEIDLFKEVDSQTFDVVTKRPFAQLLSFLADRMVVTSAELYRDFQRAADTKAPFGWGPYKLSRFDVDQQLVLQRNDAWKDGKEQRPETVVYRLMAEPEQRVSALATNEVQIARQVPPQLVPRVKRLDNVRAMESGSTEYMFLGMNCTAAPFDDVRVRQAVACSVNRQLIIDKLLFKLADPMIGALGRYHLAYPPEKDIPQYDPKRARALLAEAGYPDGVSIDFYTANGRYIADRQVAEAVTQMLKLGGFTVKLHTPDYATFVNMVREGKCPLYYTGRGATANSMEALSQFFETGVSKRINYSNAKVDELFASLRAAFEEPEQIELVRQISDILATDVPAVFMWTHRFVHGVRQDVQWTPDATGEVWLPDVSLSR